MHKETLVFFFGIVLVVLPFLGIPEDWKVYGVATIGGVLSLVGYLLRRKLYFSKIDLGNGERGDDSFTESVGPLIQDQIKT